MKGIIQRVKIQGFRSIENRDIECAQCNVFTGTNDSGKSNVLRALNLFFNQNTDFLKPLKFSEDYNKVSLARAIRSAKMKQQIRVRIYLNVPNSYSSLITEPEVYVERGFDRYGRMSEKFSNDAKKSLYVPGTTDISTLP